MIRVVDVPQEVRDVYGDDPELKRIRDELRIENGRLGALVKQFKRKERPLRAKIAGLREELRSRKVQLVHEHDWAFPTLKLLNLDALCHQHPGASIKWVPTGKLVPKVENTSVIGELAKLGAYVLKCSKCYLEGVDPPDKVAHDCPNCGIVRGSPQVFRKKATGPHAIYKSSSTYYHCRLCSVELGCVIHHGLTI